MKIELDDKELQIQKSFLNMTDTEILETYCHEGFSINKIYDDKKVEVGICSFMLIVKNTTKKINSAKGKVLSHIRSQIKLGRLGC